MSVFIVSSNKSVRPHTCSSIHSIHPPTHPHTNSHSRPTYLSTRSPIPPKSNHPLLTQQAILFSTHRPIHLGTHAPPTNPFVPHPVYPNPYPPTPSYPNIHLQSIHNPIHIPENPIHPSPNSPGHAPSTPNPPIQTNPLTPLSTFPPIHPHPPNPTAALIHHASVRSEVY